MSTNAPLSQLRPGTHHAARRPFFSRPARPVFAAAAATIMVLALGAIAGCGGGSSNSLPPTPVQNGQFTRAVSGAATIKYVALEGGFFGLITDSGEHLLPTSLDARFKKDGLRVQFDGKATENQISFQQWGVLTQINSMNEITAQ